MLRRRRPNRPRRLGVAPLLLSTMTGAALTGCSDDPPARPPMVTTAASAPSATVASGPPGTGTTVTTVTSGSGVQSAAALPKVEQIRTAVAAVEQHLGGAQQYFEINATPLLVNVFVALNNGALAQAFTYAGGTLSSTDPVPAAGHTFRKEALTFDPARLLTTVHHDLPGSLIQAVEIVGGADDAVRYTAIVGSASGGGLLVVLSPTGSVLSVDKP